MFILGGACGLKMRVLGGCFTWSLISSPRGRVHPLEEDIYGVEGILLVTFLLMHTISSSVEHMDLERVL